MKQLTLFLILLSSCSKEKEFELQNPKRTFIHSERFTNPPALYPNGSWKPYKVVEQEIAGVDYQAYENVKPDTLISTCSIDKIDSSFKIEIRTYIIR